ncbi:MAG: GEGP motif-containing diheme protein [Pseudomonadota bacterium]
MILPFLLACAALPPAPAPTPTHSDWGHPGDQDLTALTAAYPSARGGRLDDCATCHCGGDDCAAPQPGAPATNACDWCHGLQHPQEGRPHPGSFFDTLNPYGQAWLAAGRDAAAFTAIEALDCDMDGAPNGAELASGHLPGDPASRPGQPTAPLVRFTLPQLRALPSTSATLLANAPSAPEDAYATWEGVRLRDLLAAAGVDLADPGITGVTLVSPDGYRKEISRAQTLEEAPAATFYAGLDVTALGERCGWVSYGPGPFPADGAPQPPPATQVAGARDGAPLPPVALDPSISKLSGEGPLRAVVPQFTPGPPDRGSKHSPSGCDDGHDYDPQADHNAGGWVRGLVAVRVDPLPEGLEDLDWTRGGWGWIERGELVVYGRGVGE